MIDYVELGLLLFLSYAVGSINSAVIIAKIFHLPDPRMSGSKNPGTTNILRLAGKKYALMVLCGDFLKGYIPVLIAKALHFPPLDLGLVAFAAVLGHVFPIFFRFQGGKGVATTLGVLFGLQALLGLAVVGVWLLIAITTRYSSLAAIVSLSLAPAIAWLFYPQTYLVLPVFFMTILVLFLHKENMNRLLERKESKIKL